MRSPRFLLIFLCNQIIDHHFLCSQIEYTSINEFILKIAKQTKRKSSSTYILLQKYRRTFQVMIANERLNGRMYYISRGYISNVRPVGVNVFSSIDFYRVRFISILRSDLLNFFFMKLSERMNTRKNKN